MNEKETELTIGATEGTGDRPKKKKLKPGKAKSASTVSSSVKSKKGSKPVKPAKKADSSKAPKSGAGAGLKKKGGAAKKSAAPVRASGGGKKRGKSVKGSVRSTPSSTGIDPSTLIPAPNYGISRIDQPSKKNHGWYVRIGTKEFKVSEFFADKKNGGKNKARAAAVNFRNERFQELPDNLKRRGSKIRRKAA